MVHESIMIMIFGLMSLAMMMLMMMLMMMMTVNTMFRHHISHTRR
jgi:hypothetical protein